MELLDECITKFGPSSVLDHCVIYKARLLADAGRWNDVRSVMGNFLQANPDSRIYADALVYLGEASLGIGDSENAERYFQKAILSWPEKDVTRQAGLRLAEIQGPDIALQNAESLLASGQYLQAYILLHALTFHTDVGIRARSTLCLAYCCYELGRWEEASNLFMQWLNDHFDAPESPDIQAILQQIHVIITQVELQSGEPDASSSTTPRMGWLLHLFKREQPAR